jgi:hypothetical protein
MNKDLLKNSSSFKTLTDRHSPKQTLPLIIISQSFQYGEPRKSVISGTSKHLSGLNTVYDRNSVQRTNMAALAYEQTLPRLTTDCPAPVAAYDIKHANSPHGDMPYETQYRHSKLPPKATQLGLDDTVSQSCYILICTQSHQARK